MPDPMRGLDIRWSDTHTVIFVYKYSLYIGGVLQAAISSLSR